MGRIADAFARAEQEDRAALVIYLCAGDPDLAATPRLVEAVAAAGADVVELGVPFSDPTADGQAIQRASERALAKGTTLPGVLEAVRAIRARCDVPIMLFGYYNPILAYGEERLVADAADAGVDGFLVVDLPPEECAPLREPAVARGLDFVPLVAPTSDAGRIQRAADVATSFIYYVSMTGVTGAQATDLDEASSRAGALGGELGRPVAVGFGVKTPEDVRKVAQHTAGVVVGSAVVRVVEDAADADAAVKGAGELVRALAGGVRRS